MKNIKRSVAVVVRGPQAGTFLVVKRPDDPADPLAGVWGFPAVTLADGEDERAAVVRAGRDKLGVELAPGGRLGQASTDRGTYLLILADYEAAIADGTPSVPQPDASVTQYVEWRYAADPAELTEAADRGSLCAQIFLQDNSEKVGARFADGARVAESAGVVGDAEPVEPARVVEAARVAEFRNRVGLDSLIDVHTHFMPERLLAAVWAYFDAAGPLVGRRWPIAYREDEQARVATLRAFGVSAFTALLYPHKPGMARSLNDWGADFAARTPGCLQSATFFAEPSATADVRRAIEQGARVFKCHLQVGEFDPNDPVLDAAWGLLAEAGVPVITHCGSGPVAGRFTGPGPIARLLARHPRLRLVVAHLGMPEYGEFLDLAERHPRLLLDTTMAFTPFIEDAGGAFPRAELGRLRDLGDRVLLGTDFPNIPYPYADALAALERTGLGADWLRAVCRDNAARLFAL
ncbi:MAG: amidohydrolase family protein [Trebonia sp.]|jgi:predicted TIM-barrel fold metal-dependent hydrolase/ADP-ribose pyrophosphatase YjhB (NUDIX family)